MISLNKKQVETIAKGVAAGAGFVLSAVCFKQASYNKGKADAYREMYETNKLLNNYANKNNK